MPINGVSVPTSGPRRVRPKKLTAQAIAGQKGINLIEKVVLGMGCRWHPTVSLDVGIDGTIELCNPQTGAALGQVLLVQSKSVSGRFLAETDRSLEYQCDERDVDYWLQGNAPVILIVSRPAESEAYWVSVKDYFRDPALRPNARVRFDKGDDAFDENSYNQLLRAAMPASGIYLAPPLRGETLTSNLLQVTSTGSRIFVGQALVKNPEDVWSAFQGLQERPAEWVLKSDRFISFNDLTDPVWRKLCDRGTVEEFSADEWSVSGDSDQQREFVWLLNICLRRKLYPRVRFRKDINCYVFLSSRDMGPDAAAYQRPDGSTGSRNVFSVHRNEAGEISYCKHAACELQFRRFGDGWYLELQPTYVYTSDGEKLHWNQSELLSGIKRLERHQAVRGQIFMWADVIRRSGSSESGTYPHLAFGHLIQLELDAGINDKDWLSRTAQGEEEEEE